MARHLQKAYKSAVLILLLAVSIFLKVHYMRKRTAVQREPHYPKDLNRRNKDARWKALQELDGWNFDGDRLKAIDCDAMSIAATKFKRISFRKYDWFGNQLFSYRKEVDIFRQICYFRRGSSVSHTLHQQSRTIPMLINFPKLCEITDNERGTLDLLILIKSRNTHYNLRGAIRKTWGNNMCWLGKTVRHVFVLGKRNDSREQERIVQEAKHHGDIIQRDFTDHYSNNTYKTMFAFQWAIAYCPEAPIYMFVDDDFFVNPIEVVAFLEKLDPRIVQHQIIGSQILMSRVVRNGTGPRKWALSKDVYPNTYYPNYLSGGFYMVGRELALDLYIAAQFTRFLPIDDAYLGLALNKLLVQLGHKNYIHMGEKRKMIKSYFEKFLGLHGYHTASRQRLTWKQVVPKNVCSTSLPDEASGMISPIRRTENKNDVGGSNSNLMRYLAACPEGANCKPPRKS
ncbi:UDP-GlcNAc:betaGal beta-1,3-N-acetylglucosaminyltransferase 7 [Clonorchis sinensis]|uniref:Hexosyltransferase n=1 Tax=Clonorchis sinensis TaxID=79923 RepID=A0A3R7CHA0_CLOSI|nr:UDP-GlcNAc:betaGal beta-1,3-N-acetylglucosaminyltransferase 7 [Clonorchis sinensis]